MIKNSFDSERTDALKIERLIVYTVALLMVVVFILQTEFSILTIVPFTLLYFFIIIFNIILPFLNDNLKNEDVPVLSTTSINVNKLKKIATNNYYYQSGIFYHINKITQKSITIPFADIFEVSKTDIVTNNVRVWKVIAQYNNKKVTYKLKQNYSLWNNNFPDFLEELKRENPNVILSKVNLWNK